MCIIVYKPAGAELPEKSILKNCWANNPDGAGIMWADRGVVRGRKGFMKQKQVMAELEPATAWVDYDLVIHFRWATHGLRDQTATHPFPLSTDTKELTRTTWQSRSGIAHNGVISGYGTKDLSDTQEFIKLDLGHFSALADRLEVHKYLESKGGRYVLMTGKRTIMVGNFIADGGCYYSNSDYKTTYARFTGPYYVPKTQKQGKIAWADTGPINTDICPYTGRIPEIYRCETCQEFSWYDSSCELAEYRRTGKSTTEGWE